jgi:hypothetical protein
VQARHLIEFIHGEVLPLGAIIALLLREGIRKAPLDRLFGAEEEFEYTSTTSPAPETAATQS